MGLAEQPLSGGVLCWPPEGAGDFAEVAWVAAEALGNGTGVRSLQVSVHRGRVSALVYATNAGYVRQVAARFGWELHEPDEGYVTTWGQVAGINVSLVWFARDDQGRPG